MNQSSNKHRLIYWDKKHALCEDYISGWNIEITRLNPHTFWFNFHVNKVDDKDIGIDGERTTNQCELIVTDGCNLTNSIQKMNFVAAFNPSKVFIMCGNYKIKVIKTAIYLDYLNETKGFVKSEKLSLGNLQLEEKVNLGYYFIPEIYTGKSCFYLIFVSKK
jgi:hypothetical protein